MAKQWTSEQLANARVIMQVGRSVGASDRDILIGLMTAWQESGLRNLSYGDRDSVGLFQQRNGWGSLSTRMNPTESARMFFLGGQQGQRGLLDFNQRNGWSLTQAAQKVQVSAFPDAYAKWEDRSRGMLAELGANPGVDPQAGSSVVIGAPTVDPSKELPGTLGAPVQVPTTAMGLDAAVPSNGDMSPPGLGAMAAPGIESADQQPGSAGLDFLPSSGPGGFEEMFPKSGIVGGQRARVVDFAKSLLGTPYQWGGTTVDGVDCSGFTQLVYKQTGIMLPRVSAAQAAYGKRTDIGSLQPGDMVAWDSSARNNGADHIAIYIGNGQIIESPRPGLGVRIRTLDNNEGAWGVSLNYQ